MMQRAQKPRSAEMIRIFQATPPSAKINMTPLSVTLYGILQIQNLQHGVDANM
jgi:hypothetical protein